MGIDQDRDSTLSEHGDSAGNGIQVFVVVLARLWLYCFPDNADSHGVEALLHEPVSIVLVKASGLWGVRIVLVDDVRPLSEESTAVTVGKPATGLSKGTTLGDGSGTRGWGYFCSERLMRYCTR